MSRRRSPRRRRRSGAASGRRHGENRARRAVGERRTGANQRGGAFRRAAGGGGACRGAGADRRRGRLRRGGQEHDARRRAARRGRRRALPCMARRCRARRRRGWRNPPAFRSRTLASWEHGWEAGRGALGPKDVLVIDEAGMVGSRQLSRVRRRGRAARARSWCWSATTSNCRRSGPGRRSGRWRRGSASPSLSEIRRQREDWQRGAAQDFARHQTGEGLAAYAERGAVTFAGTRDGARGEIVRDYMRRHRGAAGGVARGDGASARRRAGAQCGIRAARQERGELARGEAAGERTFPDQRRRAGLRGGRPHRVPGEQPRPRREERHARDGDGRRGRADHGSARRQGPRRRGAHGVRSRRRITPRSTTATPRRSTRRRARRWIGLSCWRRGRWTGI